jgi:diguanylate cyclase (GGDEF)-like protein/PAS domain S-box-containing protein
VTATRGSAGLGEWRVDRGIPDRDDLFHRLASSSPIGILLFDTEGQVTFANERWRETVGIGLEDVVTGFDWIEFVHPDDRDSVLATARSASARDGVADFECRFLRRDGEVRWNHTRSAAIRGPDGGVRGFVATCEDVTAERDAAEAQGRLTQALETTPDFVVIMEADGRVIYANEAVRDAAGGADNAELAALASPESFTRDSWDTIVHEVWPALREKGEWQGELTIVRGDGAEVPVIQSARAHRDADGRVVYISAIARDITELRTFERQLAESEALFRALVERSHDLVSLFGTDGRFVYASPSHAQVLGFEPSELIGRHALDMLHPDDRERVAQEFADQLVGGTPIQPIEMRQLCRDGSYRWIEAVAQDRTADPAVQGIIVNARDVTERKRAEQLAADEARILEQVARGAPLEETLVSVVAMVERVLDDVVGALVAHEPDASGPAVLAAARLDPDVVTALETDAGPGHTSKSDEIFVRDFEDPEEGTSEARRALCARGIRAAWVARLWNPAVGESLGALLVLRRDRRLPSPADHQLLSLAGSVAAIAIARDREVTSLARAARRDPLTGLANRMEVVDRLAAIGHSAAPVTAVLFLDLDRFKLLNDRHGHVAGDRVLVEIAGRLRSVTRPGDLVARLGGDEFVVVCDHLSTPDEALEIAGRVLAVVRDPVTIGDREVVVTTSIGIATAPGEDPDAVLRDADAAMYRAKERGRDRVEYFEPREPLAAPG